MERVTEAEIRAITAPAVADVSPGDRDEMAIPSYTHANPLIRWLMWRRYAVIERLAELREGETVLEFGCGIGLFLPTLARAERTVYALDLFPQYAQALVRRRGLAARFVPDVGAVPDGSLDLIVAADVLEHVDDLPAYVAAFRRKLGPGGRALVSGPTENVAYRVGRLLAGFAGKGDYHHTEIDAIRRVFEATGFRTTGSGRLPCAVPPHLFKVFRFEPTGGHHAPTGPGQRIVV